MIANPHWFIARPGQPGTIGAIMDEYARAADDYCNTIEHIPTARFLRENQGGDEHGRSLRAIAAHAISAAFNYADYIRSARKLGVRERIKFEADSLTDAGEVRAHLADAIRYTEDSLAGLEGATDDTIAAITFQVRWGPTYDPEMLLEHAIVHLLRHRRQVQRWPL